MNSKKTNRIKRHKRIRAKALGTSETPRVSVFRSNKYIYAQVVDDENNKTLFSASDIVAKAKTKKTDSAKDIGVKIAKMASEKNIKKVIFDRGGYKYHGRVKAVAEGAREGGLEF